MPERDGYIPGVPCWYDTNRGDPDAAFDFYGGLFGWEFENVIPDDAPGSYFVGRIRGGDVAAVGSMGEDGEAIPAWNTYVCVDSADDTSEAVRGAGGAVISEPFEVMDAGRMAVLADPEGAAFCVWQPKSHLGAKVVNEHGAVNFNGLATRDVERAAQFYGNIFGWQVLDLPSGPMWALPGYGDHLEETNPGLRQQMTKSGAPDGFVDVVAAIQPISTEDVSTPAHWSITFAVDDVGVAAARAAELGGEVLAGPFDAPWTRVAVIRDPQGASFIASQFVPENREVAA